MRSSLLSSTRCLISLMFKNTVSGLTGNISQNVLLSEYMRENEISKAAAAVMICFLRCFS